MIWINFTYNESLGSQLYGEISYSCNSIYDSQVTVLQMPPQNSCQEIDFISLLGNSKIENTNQQCINRISHDNLYRSDDDIVNDTAPEKKDYKNHYIPSNLK